MKFFPPSALQEGIYFCSTVCRELNVINEEWIDRSYFNVLANFHYGERPRRMEMDECMVSLYECDLECMY